MFNHTYNLVHSKRISHTMEVLLPDQNFVEKMETLEASLVAPTPSSDLWVHSEFTAFPGQTPPTPNLPRDEDPTTASPSPSVIVGLHLRNCWDSVPVVAG